MQPVIPAIHSKRHALHLAAPIDRWDEAIPLGNGLMGALLWGGGCRLMLSLDRGDLWDLRTPEEFLSPDFNWQTIKDSVARGDQLLLRKRFEEPYGKKPYPTKLPVGRIEVTLGGQGDATAFQLDLRRAIGRVALERGRAEVFCSSAAPVGMMCVSRRTATVKIQSAFGAAGLATADQSPGAVASLGYAPPACGRKKGVVWCRQTCADGLIFVIAVGLRRQGRDTWLSFTVTTNRDAPDAVGEACRRVTGALQTGYDAMRRGHARYWRRFWSQSAVRLDDLALERHYYLVNYFYGSASRRGAPPIPLQGVWTADNGALPPWKGDYHHDLNTQMTYWAYLAANHLDEGLCFLDFMSNLLPVFQTNAEKFYGTPGACVPGVMSLDGRQMGGWHQYAYSPTNGVWVAHNFYRHWLYTRDHRYLREDCYPFCREHARHIEALLTPGADGKLKLPFSSSPEFLGNSLDAWVTPNSNHDLALMRWLFGAMAEMAADLGDGAESAHWVGRLSQMDELAVGPQGSLPGMTSWSVKAGLYIAPGTPLPESHRHFAHLMAIYPLGILHVEGTDRDREIIGESLRVMDFLGMSFWVGFSLTWMACLAARCGRGERAWQMLKLFLDTTVSRNGFNLNGDYRQLGVLGPSYRPFTLEANFAAAEAVHEMLVQGWGGRLRLFPAVPALWRDVAFADLRTEGAFIVSAWRKNGAFSRAEVFSEKGGPLCLRHPHPTRSVEVSLGGWKRVYAPTAEICLPTTPGERYVVSVI